MNYGDCDDDIDWDKEEDWEISDWIKQEREYEELEWLDEDNLHRTC